MYYKNSTFIQEERSKTEDFQEIKNSYLLLMGEYNIIITFKPQGVDDPGVRHNQQSTRKEIVDTKHTVNNLLRPLLRIKAGVAFLYKMFIQECRELDNQSDYPRNKNNHLQKMYNPH